MALPYVKHDSIRIWPFCEAGHADLPGHTRTGTSAKRTTTSRKILELLGTGQSWDTCTGCSTCFYSFPVTSHCTKTGSFYRGEPPTCTSPWQVVKKTIMIWQTTSTWHVKHVKHVKKVVWATVRIRQVRDEERMRKDVTAWSLWISHQSQNWHVSKCRSGMLCFLKLSCNIGKPTKTTLLSWTLRTTWEPPPLHCRIQRQLAAPGSLFPQATGGQKPREQGTSSHRGFIKGRENTVDHWHPLEHFLGERAWRHQRNFGMIWRPTICAKGIWDGTKMHGNRWKPLRWPEKANATHNENLGRFRFQPAATCISVSHENPSLNRVLMRLEIFLGFTGHSGFTLEPVSENSLTAVNFAHFPLTVGERKHNTSSSLLSLHMSIPCFYIYLQNRYWSMWN